MSIKAEIVEYKSYFWIAPLPPHWDDWVGPYDDFDEAEDDAVGMERTINSLDWRMFMVELEDDFEESWNRRLLP